MRRRGSNTMDEADMRDAFRHLLSPRKKEWAREIVSDIVLLGGGGLLAWGLTLYPDAATRSQGVQMAWVGVGVSIFGLLFRHFPFKR